MPKNIYISLLLFTLLIACNNTQKPTTIPQETLANLEVKDTIALYNSYFEDVVYFENDTFLLFNKNYISIFDSNNYELITTIKNKFLETEGITNYQIDNVVPSPKNDIIAVFYMEDLPCCKGRDRFVDLIELESHKVIHTIQNDNPTNSFTFEDTFKAFVPNSSSFITQEDNTIHFWSIDNQIISQDAFSIPGSFSKFKSDGKILITHNEGDNLWNLQEKKLLNNFQQKVRAYNEDATLAVSYLRTDLPYSEYLDEVKIWQVASGELLNTYRQSTGSYDFDISPIRHTVKFVNNDQYIAEITGESIVVWNVDDGKTIYSIYSFSEFNQIDPIGQSFIYESFDTENLNQLVVADVATGDIRFSLGEAWNSKLPESISNITYNQDGSKIVTNHRNGTMKIWDVQNGNIIYTLSKGSLNHGVSNLIFNSDDTYLSYSSFKINLFDKTSSPSFNVEGNSDYVKYTPNGEYILLSNENIEDSSIVSYSHQLHSSTTGEKILEFTTKGFVNSITFSSDKKYYATTSGEDGTIVWNLNSGLKEFIIPEFSVTSSFSTENDNLFATAGGKYIEIWNIDTKQKLYRFDEAYASESFNEIKAVSFSNENKHVSAISNDNTLNTWNLENGELILSTFVRPKNAIFSPDGSLIASTLSEGIGTLHLTRTSDGKVLKTLNGHFEINSLAFSHDGKTLAVGAGLTDQENTITLYGTPNNLPIFIDHN